MFLLGFLQMKVLFCYREVPIQVGSLEGGSHEGNSPRAFSTNGKHMNMGTSTYVIYILFLFFSFLFL
jgi:hypothetical protein